MFNQCFLGLFMVLMLAACSTYSSKNHVDQQETVSFPLLRGWHDGEEVLYITTDVSDRAIAKAKNVNYAPRLRYAVPNYPKPPQVKTALERVYAFPDNVEYKSVFASVPTPFGPESRDRHYSPLWLMYTVVWNDSSKARELRSEEAIFVAEDQGLVTITRTNVVLNCPVIPFSITAL